MERRPLNDEPEGPRRQLSTYYTQILDLDHRLELRILRMEVRRRMIVIVHVDGDAEELGDLWQAGPLAEAADDAAKCSFWRPNLGLHVARLGGRH